MIALPPWRPHPHLFQINTWAWLDELSRAAGRTLQLADVPDAEWDRIEALGFDLVYLLGVWQRSPGGRHMFRTDTASFPVFDHALPGWTMDAIVGSPFSIRAYAPDARIGSWAQLDGVRRKLHARGMRLILDFVPNHTGPDHAWIENNPEYYLQGTLEDYRRDPNAYHLIEPDESPPLFIARGRDPYFAPWADTAQLDYSSEAARGALLDTLGTIAAHCDGLRCDMAMLVLNDVFGTTWASLLRDRSLPSQEFWAQAIGALRDDFLWMAEVYWGMEGVLQQQGFDYTYDKRLYDCLRSTSPAEVRAQLSADCAVQSRMARFLENHDEPRSAAVMDKHRLPALTALLMTLPGLRFLHQGQLEGKCIHLPMPLNAAAPEAPDLALARTYERILHIADAAAFHAGEWKLLAVDPDNDATYSNLIAYRWRFEQVYKLIVVNLGDNIAHGRIRAADEWPPAAQLHLADALDGQIYRRERSDLLANGLYVRLDAHGAHIFSVTACDITHPAYRTR